MHGRSRNGSRTTVVCALARPVLCRTASAPSGRPASWQMVVPWGRTEAGYPSRGLSQLVLGMRMVMTVEVVPQWRNEERRQGDGARGTRRLGRSESSCPLTSSRADLRGGDDLTVVEVGVSALQAGQLTPASTGPGRGDDEQPGPQPDQRAGLRRDRDHLLRCAHSCSVRGRCRRRRPGRLSGAGFFLRHAAAGQAVPRRVRAAATLVLTNGTGVARGIQSHCLTTAVLAERLGLGPELGTALRQFFTRWGRSRRPGRCGCRRRVPVGAAVPAGRRGRGALPALWPGRRVLRASRRSSGRTRRHR